MLSETLKQIAIINSPLPLDAVVKREKNVHKDDKYDYAEEQEQRKARHTQTHETDSEIERMRLEFELTILKRQHEENDKQRLHEEKMEHIRQGSPSRSGAHVEEEQFVGKLDPITEIELEKLRMEFELAKLKYEHEENERQRQHEQKMEQLRQQAPSGQVRGGHHFLLPHDPLTLFLYCFIFIHLIYIAKELIFFFFKKHGMFAIGAVLIFAIKIFWN
uniref:Transmembrane protein 247 n=1 Tax=Laticauda laticaudata TaxID=8630 RepID=A0A8C5SCC5_LATLA